MLTFDMEAEKEYMKNKNNETQFIFCNDELDISRIITIIKEPPKVILQYKDNRTGDIIETIETDPFELDVRKYESDE